MYSNIYDDQKVIDILYQVKINEPQRKVLLQRIQ